MNSFGANAFDLNSILVSGFLIWGVVEDLRLRKVRNNVILAIGILSLLTYIVSAALDYASYWNGLAAFGTALVIAVPFSILRVLGAGDVKLLAVCALLMTSLGVFETFVYSFAWGSLLGVFQIALKGELNVLFINLGAITKVGGRKEVSGGSTPIGLHHIPYTFAILLGWFTHLSLNRIGVSIL
ncbi:MAG: prepilin peptidase [Pseudobdellovibrionaceae bacterium]